MNEMGLNQPQVGIVEIPAAVVQPTLHETLKIGGFFQVKKFHAVKDGGVDRLLDDYPYEVSPWIPNGYTNAGGVILLSLLIAYNSQTSYTQANAYLGAGDSNTAFTVSQTNLQAATNKTRQNCSSVSIAGQVCSFIATFATGSANYAWEEVGIFNDPSAGTMLARSVSSYGTKTSASSWQLTYTLTVP